MKIIFPWVKKKIEKAIAREIRRKYGMQVVDFDYNKSSGENVCYYLILEDGTLIHASVNPKQLNKHEAFTFFG